MTNKHAISPIPTEYNRTIFRSRLEARWAVFYDTLGVKWLYEFEGYQLPSGWYLPDFWLPDHKMWVEVKPKKPTEIEGKLARELAIATDYSVLIQYGPPEVPKLYAGIEGVEIYDADGWDCCQWWCECSKCGAIGIAFCGRDPRICGRKCWDTQEDHWDRHWNFDCPRLKEAYRLARTYRFW